MLTSLQSDPNDLRSDNQIDPANPDYTRGLIEFTIAQERNREAVKLLKEAAGLGSDIALKVLDQYSKETGLYDHDDHFELALKSTISDGSKEALLKAKAAYDAAMDKLQESSVRYLQAVRYLKTKNALKNPEAKVILGQIYLENKGIPRDLEYAEALFKGALEEGSIHGYHNYGILNLTKNPAAAVSYLQIAAMRNYLPSQIQIAICLEKGIGFEEKNVVAAFLAAAEVIFSAYGPHDDRSRNSAVDLVKRGFEAQKKILLAHGKTINLFDNQVVCELVNTITTEFDAKLQLKSSDFIIEKQGIHLITEDGQKVRLKKPFRAPQNRALDF